MRAEEVMTSDPACCSPDDTIQQAAEMMERHGCGCLPVVEDPAERRRVVGVVTDRDIAVRGVREGKGSDTPVHDVMSDQPSCCSPDAGIDEVEQTMSERQVRRVPVVDERGCCVGMVAQADLARGRQAGDVARTLGDVSQPTHAPRT